jgi:DNA polymerase III delta subunit
MSTYFQWKKRKSSPKRVTWVCGPEKFLIEEIIGTIRDFVAPSKLDNVILDAKTSSYEEIWDQIEQYPLVPGSPRLIVVKNVENITNWTPLESWLDNTRLTANIYLVLVSSQPSLYGEKDDNGAREWLPPLLIHKNVKVSTIECRKLKNSEIITWAQSKVVVDDQTAKYLVERTGGRLPLIASIAYKANLFNSRLTTKVIDAFCEENPVDDFVLLLLSMKKTQALLVADKLAEDYDSIFTDINNKLELLDELNTAVRGYLSPREIAQIPGVSVQLAEELLPIAKHYDREKQKHCRRILAIIENAYNSGARENVLELLVSLW